MFPTGTVPLSNVVPSSLVTVWGAAETFFQITVVPTLIVSVVGLKAKLPSPLVMIIMICIEPATGVCRTAVGGIAVGVGAATVVVGGVVGSAVTVLPPPQAASSTSRATKITNRENLLDALREYIFFSIIFSFL